MKRELRPEDIRYEKTESRESRELLSGEIDGAKCSTFEIVDGEYTERTPDTEAVVIIMLDGECKCLGKSFEGITVFAFAEGEEISISSKSAYFLRISWQLLEGEGSDKSRLPYALRYDDAVKYREDCKSEKTVSRMLLDEGIIPRIGIGSVQTTGPDRVEKHEHPFCDQLFFSFPENDMTVEMDNVDFAMSGNTLLHIPLASSHGVAVHERGIAHYIWMDFVIDPRGIEYLHSAHEEIK